MIYNEPCKNPSPCPDQACPLESNPTHEFVPLTAFPILLGFRFHRDNQSPTRDRLQLYRCLALSLRRQRPAQRWHHHHGSTTLPGRDAAHLCSSHAAVVLFFVSFFSEQPYWAIDGRKGECGACIGHHGLMYGVFVPISHIVMYENMSPLWHRITALHCKCAKGSIPTSFEFRRPILRFLDKMRFSISSNDCHCDEACIGVDVGYHIRRRLARLAQFAIMSHGPPMQLEICSPAAIR